MIGSLDPSVKGAAFWALAGLGTLVVLRKVFASVNIK